MMYPIGIQDFGKLRKAGYVYVDKTALVYQLTRNLSCHFLSRPRRFGKSLLISTLEAYFLGRRELFKGLAMEELEKEWTQYPVLHMDLNASKYDTPEDLEDVLNDNLTQWEAQYGTRPSEKSPSLRFKGVIQRAHQQTGQMVVVLVDEYDKPLLNTIDREALHAANLDTLKAFFGVLKSQDAHIRFALLTGVSRFSHVSVFSDLNNLNDISMDAQYVDICGITEKELHVCFDDSIHELAAANGMTFGEACEELRRRYDGYHFCEHSVGIYNPFSLLNTFVKKTFADYWFNTGTPTFLVKLLRQNDYDLRELRGVQADANSLTRVDESHGDPIPLLFQTGYLTIQGYDRMMGYTLDFPNQEVEQGFIGSLLPYYTPQQSTNAKGFLNKMTHAIQEGRADDLMLLLQTMLSGKPYVLEGGNKEVHFQNTLYVVFTMLGYNVQVEQHTSRGRMDVTIQTPDYIYILELKMDSSAEEALQQIKDKHYAQPFQMDSRRLFLIGANFSSATRTVEEWVVA